MTTSDGGVFFISGANKVQEMSEEEFNRIIEQAKTTTFETLEESDK